MSNAEWKRLIESKAHTIATDAGGQCHLGCSQYNLKNYCHRAWMDHQFRRPGPECPLCDKANAQARIRIEIYEEAPAHD